MPSKRNTTNLSSAVVSFSQVLLALVALIFIATAAQAQAPVGWWKFDNSSGLKVADSSGHGHAATLVNGARLVSGQVGDAVSVDGTQQQYVNVPAIDLSSTRAVTISLWVNRSYSTAGGHVLFEATADYNHSATGFSLLPDDDVCQGIQVAMHGDVGYTGNCYGQPSSGVWHHFAVVFDKSQTAGDQIELYLDGVLQNPSRSLFAATNTNRFGNDPIYLFSRGGTKMFGSGAIADFRIYDSALAAAQVQQIYSAGYDSMAMSRQRGSFTISASPTSLSIAQGNQGTSTITTAGFSGFNSPVGLSATGVPNGTTVSFNPNPIPAPGTGSSTMTINVSANTAVGTYPITVTGNGGGIQQRATVTVTVTVTSNGVALDGNVHGVQDSGSNSTNTESVSLGTPTAGDLITCEVTFDSGNSNALVSVSDNNNGTYAAAVPVHLNSSMVQWFGIYYKENVSGSPTTVTLKTTQSRPYTAIACQAWKGVASANSLDTGFSQLKDAVSAPNPTTGSNKTPTANGELVIAAVGLINSGAPTPGSNYTLIDGATQTRWWPEYWIQTTATATAGNYSRGADTWTDMMAAFMPSASGNFAISASPTSLSIVQGGEGASTISTNISGGFNSAINLSATGVPNGTTVSFNPNPIAAPGNGSSTMTINVGANTAVGTYPITVTGSGGGIQHSTTVTLTVTAAADYAISANPSAVSIAQGKQGSSTISTTISGGFNSAISLSATGVPNGTTVSFNPNPIAAPGNGSSTMTINVGANTAVGTYPITVTGSGGGIQHSTTVTLTVTAAADYAISANPSAVSIAQGKQGSSTITTTISGGFNSTISLSATGVPNGTTVSFNPNPIAAPGNGASTMTINVGANTAVGTYPITVTGSGGGIQHSTTVTLTVTAAADYAISANPSAVSIAQGNQGTSTITTTISGGFNSTISLSATGVPNGTTVSFNPNPIAAPGNGSSTMTINVGANTAVGTYPITVTGNGGGIQHSTTVTLTVTAAADYAISANPSAVSIAQGNQGTSTITTTISGGFNSTISLSATGVPNGSTVSFNPNPIAAPGNGSSTMTINVGANTAVGTYPITVTGSGGGIQHSTTMTLSVTAAADYAISANPSAVSIAQGSQGTSTITTTISGGFNSAISLSATGVPNGTTVSFNPNPIAAPGNGASTMTINVGANTAVGTYPITVTGSGGGIQHSTTVTLTVTAAANFTISASPMALNLLQGSQGTSTISTTISGGFNSAVSLSASGVPNGTIVSFSPNPIPAPGGGQSTMTITVGMNTVQGTYPIVITGSGGGIQHSVTLTLTVTAEVYLSWDPSGSQGIAGYNVYRSLTTGGPYTKINTGLVVDANYIDQAVQDGQTYFYVATAVDQQQQESGYSNEASAFVP